MAKVQSELESSRRAYTLGTIRHDPDSYLFMLERGSDPMRWSRVRDEDSVDISSGQEKFIRLTSADINEILGTSSVPLVFTEDQHRLMSAALTLRAEVFSNPNLSTKEKSEIVKRLRRDYAKEEKGLKVKLDENGWKQKALLAEKDVLEAFKGPLVLQRPTGTVFHKAREAFADGSMLMPYANFDDGDGMAIAAHEGMRGGLAGDHHIFLIEHNWAGAFADSNDLDGAERRMPYPLTAFELQVNSRRIVVNIAQWDEIDGGVPDGYPPLSSIVAIQTKVGWMLPMAYEFGPSAFVLPDRLTRKKEIEQTPFIQTITPLMALIHAQIRAILIMLSAEVAETPVVRIPHKLNEKRVKQGKRPMMDYHVVSLSKRTRYSPLSTGPNHEPSHRKKLHWRRGHDRHYPTYKVWIKRQLVGNPDLGFIDKHYRL